MIENKDLKYDIDKIISECIIEDLLNENETNEIKVKKEKYLLQGKRRS